MSCALWQDQLEPGRFDDMNQGRREQFLAHLQGCSSCRQAAADADPTLVFSLLPAEEIDQDEVREIQRTVQTMRRVRALEASWSKPAWRGLGVAAFAALALMIVVLLPVSTEKGDPDGVPFAGAVGVGSGLVSIPQTPGGGHSVDLQVELARSARMADLSGSPAMQRISNLEVNAEAGEWVDRDLGDGYRIRFQLSGEAPGSSLVMQSFQLIGLEEEGEVSLFDADLQPLSNQPLIVGVTPREDSQEQLWLLLTYSVDAPEAP